MIINITAASAELGFSSRTPLQRLIKAGKLDAYLRGRNGRSILIETEPEGLPTLRQAVQESTVARIGSPLWSSEDYGKPPSIHRESRLEFWARVAEIGNASIEPSRWGPPPWSQAQWAVLAPLVVEVLLEAQELSEE